MKKKTGIFLIIGIVLALMLTGCGKQSVETETSHTTEEDKLQIGLSFDSFVIERWLRDRDMFVSTAQSLGAEVNVQVAGGEVEEQISQIEYFIQKKMDVIIIIPIDGDALYDVVKEAKSKGICVICYDRIIPNVNADLYITIDNEMVGTLMGEALKKACPDGGNIFAIYGSPTDKNVEEVEKGFKDALVDSKLNIVYSGYCDNWLAEIAETHVNKGLEVTDDIVGVMCGNDDLASQVVKVLSENRLAGQVAVVAQDAELAACQRIVELFEQQQYECSALNDMISLEYGITKNEKLMKELSPYLRDCCYTYLLHYKPKTIKLLLELLDLIHTAYGRNSDMKIDGLTDEPVRVVYDVAYVDESNIDATLEAFGW